MPYAKIDENNKIIEWSYDKLEGLNIEFSNGEYIDEKCVNGLQDFKIVDGIAIFDPEEETLELINGDNLKDKIKKIEENQEDLILIVADLIGN